MSALLPKQYQFLEKEGAPRMLVEFLNIYGIEEVKGAGDNPVILLWAKEVGVEKDYKHDATAWCGLEMAVIAKRAGKQVVKNPLWARNWLNFGEKAEVAKLGYVLVFSRKGGGGHVGLYVGEDDTHYHVAGGNQGDTSSIVRIAKDRCIGIRKPVYKTAEPANVRVIILDDDGPASENEA